MEHPTNVGAIFRSAAALDVDAVLVTPRCADPLYRRAVRVSMGTVFQVPWVRLEHWTADLQRVKDAGFLTAALALSDDAVTVDSLAAEAPEKLALILGTEGQGLGAATLHHADRHVIIPMSHGGGLAQRGGGECGGVLGDAAALRPLSRGPYRAASSRSSPVRAPQGPATGTRCEGRPPGTVSQTPTGGSPGGEPPVGVSVARWRGARQRVVHTPRWEVQWAVTPWENRWWTTPLEVYSSVAGQPQPRSSPARFHAPPMAPVSLTA